MRYWHRTVLSVIGLVLLILAGQSPVLTRAERAVDKIAPWVIANTMNGAEAEFIVVLAEQANLDKASELATKAEKGRYVYETLWDTAQASQGTLLAWLEARNVPHRSYYIVNALWVKGNYDVALALALRSDVARIEGNPRILNVMPTPSTPFFDLLAAAPATVETGIAYVRAPEVWAMGYTGQGVVVGGQDTGYDWTHPALKSHYRGWDGATATHDYNWHDSIHSGGGSCGADAPAPCDDYSHGTHTMGTIVGDDGGSNQIGMAPGAQWIGCRNMDVGVGTPATYLECFEFFLAPYPVGGTPAQGDPNLAPDVTNNSWTCPDYEGCSWDTLQAAVEAQRAAGIMTVVSASNSGPSCSTVDDSPAVYAASYAVGALTTGTDTIWLGSSRGPVTADGSNRSKPDIAAPGTSVRSCIPGGGYSLKTGTSMAAPHVAGAVALLWSARPALKNQVAATEQLLNDNAFHIASTECSSSGWPNNVYGYGRLDIKAAVDTMYGVVLWPSEVMRNGNVGATVVYTLVMTNTGTISDTYALAQSGATWTTTLTPASAVLEPGGAAPVRVTVTVPLGAPTGITDTVRVTASGTGVTAHSDLTTAAVAADCLPLIGENFSYSPVLPMVGQVVTFTGSVNVGTEPIVYEWDFGDGSAVATGQVVTHSFPAATIAMPYTVVMTVTNMCDSKVVPKPIAVGVYTLYLPMVLK